VTTNLVQTRMATAAEPAFHDVLEEVWGRRWGAHDETGVLRIVLVRPPSSGLARIRADAWDEDAQALVDPEGRWYWTDRRPPDLDRLAQQHRGLVHALVDEGVDVVVAPPMDGAFTKAVYVRDPIVTVPGGAIVGRMAVLMRRGEEADLSRVVAGAGMPVLGTMTGTATLEGGSFVKLRDGVAALGTSIRCNDEAADELRDVLARIGWELVVVPLPGFTIHLDMHLAMLDVDLALADVGGLPYTFLARLGAMGIDLVHAGPGELWGLNLLALGPRRVLMAEGSPVTTARLRDAGVEVRTVAYDEIHRNGGGVHCSTIELVRDPAQASAANSASMPG
jgi:N-dimethylarginine dimethylaminohydrolase